LARCPATFIEREPVAAAVAVEAGEDACPLQPSCRPRLSKTAARASTNALEGTLDQPGLSGDNDGGVGSGSGSGRRAVSNEEDTGGCTALAEERAV